jgi:hypothetical protein
MQQCPVCEYFVNAVGILGNAVICVQCGAHIKLNGDRTLRAASIEEVLAIQESPEWPGILAIRHHIMTLRAQQEPGKIKFKHEE